jgi:hypothetical protein
MSADCPPPHGEVTLFAQEAENRRDRINILMDSVSDAYEEVVDLITQARDREDHVALGYASWAEYVSAEYAGRLTRLDAGSRHIASLTMAQAGMSIRAIAPILGVSKSTIARDLVSGVPSGTPDGDPVSQVVHGAPAEPGPTVAGRDGKTYRPANAHEKPRRRSLPDAYWDAAYDLAKVVARLEKLTADDRFPANRAAVSAKHRAELKRMWKALWKVESALGEGDQ